MRLNLVKTMLLVGAVMLAVGIVKIGTSCKTNFAEKDGKLRSTFNNWTLKHGKTYATPSEKEYRISVFANNIQKIQDHLAQKDNSYTMGLTQFSDLTSQEFESKLGVASAKDLQLLNDLPVAPQYQSLGQQASIDLRNQLQQQSMETGSACNNHYAWNAALSLNANFYIRNSGANRYAFSPQTFLDCSSNFGNNGCGGGNTLNSYTYSQNWGVDTLINYPYYGVQRQCRALTGYYRNTGVYKIASLSNTDV